MAEDETQLFDPSMKKKKKKKAFDPDALLDDKPAEPATSIDETQSNTKLADETPVVSMDNDDFDFTKMKKKPKKKKAFDMSELTQATETIENEDSPREPDEPSEEKTEENAVDSLDFNFATEKKKKKKKQKFDDILSEKAADQPSEDSEAWVDSGKDYTYDELLKRVFEIMKEKNPDMVAGEKKRLVMKPPQVVKIGAKKTSFANFTDICKSLHRQPKHLLAFLMAELGTSGSIDGNSQLIIKGRFQSKQIENVLRNYIKEYVSCHTCKSPDTILQKDTRLYFLQCETCRSRCSVSSIKSGFQAVTGKRAAIRAKTA